MALKNNIKNLDFDGLNVLSEEIRNEIIEVVTKNGGHLSSNLGVVEMTVALHYVFDFPNDKLIFDVGHQCYAHKILTRDGFETLRKKGGLSGFPKSEESIYDTFDSGHSSTALSVACGFMRARALNGGNYQIVSVVGDGSLGGGMCFEALNDCANIDGKQIIVINDNDMTISKTYGGISRILGNREVAKTFFESFGFYYIGRVNGHDMKSLVLAFEQARNIDKSVVVHILTEKGRGCVQAENCPEKFHSVSLEKSAKTYADQLGDSLIEVADKNNKIVAVTAAMKNGTGLGNFAERFPERFFDVGIAEGHAVTMCAGMAKAGLKPFFAVYSSFLQRGFDQIVHDIMIQKLPVTLCLDHSGVVSADGETHQGIINISFLRSANMSILSPQNLKEFDAMIKWSATQNMPLAIRYPKGSVSNNFAVKPVAYGKWDYLKCENENGILLYTGAYMCNFAYKIKKSIMKKGLNLSTINAKFVNPVDYELLDSVCDKKIFVMEDNIFAGGLASAILEYYSKKGYDTRNIKSISFGNNVLIPNMTVDEAYAEYGFRLEGKNGLIQQAEDFFVI